MVKLHNLDTGSNSVLTEASVHHGKGLLSQFSLPAELSAIWPPAHHGKGLFPTGFSVHPSAHLISSIHGKPVIETLGTSQ